MITKVILSVSTVVILTLMGFLVWDGILPSAGLSVPILSNTGNHVPEGMNPGPFNSEPITSGPHYTEEYDAGFYEETSPEAQGPYPEGYLGHNLEHGYVIYWYNCDPLGVDQCEALKLQTKESMFDNGGTKLIAFPQKSLDVPVVMTSWGQMLRLEDFNISSARKFVQANRNHAPEPNAP